MRYSIAGQRVGLAILCIALLSPLLASCASEMAGTMLPGSPPGSSTEYDTVHVFYGTDRARTDGKNRPHYTSVRAKRLETGMAQVTIPKLHRVPEIERPYIYRLPFTDVVLYEEKEDPAKHFTIARMEVWPKDRFPIRIAGLSYDHALVFIHGFNTTFDAALYRAAQLAYDMQFDGQIYMYSWPSRGKLGATDYNYDQDSTEVAEPYLKEFLEIVSKDSGTKKVSIIAHSMGNRLLMPVLAELKRSSVSSKIAQVIFAAPDVSRDQFEQLAAQLNGVAKGVTLYAAGNDRALQASRKYAGGVARAGDVPNQGPVVVAGVDTIDVTAVSTEVLSLNHSGYAEKSALLTDISLLLKTGVRPPDRRIPILKSMEAAGRPYWRYPG
jgi:esterase/lipase superfamily enzyme